MSHELSLVAMTKAINIDNSINKSIIPIEPTRSKEINERNKSNCWVTGRQRKKPTGSSLPWWKGGSWLQNSKDCFSFDIFFVWGLRDASQ